MKNPIIKYGAIAGAVSMILALAGTLYQYRPWVSFTVFMLAANTAYSAEGKLLSQSRIDIDLLILKCKADPKCEDMKALEQMKANVDKEIKKKEAELEAIKGKE